VEVLEISLPCGVFSLGLTKPMELGPAMKLEYVVDAFVGKSTHAGSSSSRRPWLELLGVSLLLC